MMRQKYITSVSSIERLKYEDEQKELQSILVVIAVSLFFSVQL